MTVQSKITKICSYIEETKEEALDFLEKLVEIDSYSHDKEGVSRVSYLIKDKLEAQNISCEIHTNEVYGTYLVATLKGNKEGKILLVGHQDTAHPTGTTNQFPFQNDGDLLKGPGVSDMKSGLVYMVYVLLAFKKCKPKEMCDIELLFTPDEEIGSPVSKDVIKQRAESAIAAFVLEPGRPDGTIVTSRKGSAHLKIEIEGKAAHSGAFIEKGISANDELALKMIEIKKLVDHEKDLTINFGVIKGGVSNNIVSPHATATIHCAFWNTNDFNEVYNKIVGIVEHSFIKGTKSQVSGEIGMLPMENTEKNNELYENIVLKAAKDLELNIVGAPTKGASEAGFTSSIGTPTICGMGPVGGNWHTENEYLEINSFLPRMKLLATSLLYCADYYK
ncbi:M20 family metallopeptidase [Virgibacillus halodenitrificans]|uniref:M20 family metallopeptidase n=1 Tax=Virgibacillus halodenitrificans TaxID=1482 RepID=A0ABR7VK53_VIRHA|nr:M20 family metallopeptidase [Virgibacillus halodenitrificans]MBD1221237.1 M20 family metallopeptidase [Virgibacillus halodenitrificans]MCJ0929802.1 M20 family metallopeptidase [Virgibacillus halodenitrificans]